MELGQFKRGMAGGATLRIKGEQMAVRWVLHRIPNQPVWQLESSRRRFCSEISLTEGIYSQDELTVLAWPFAFISRRAAVHREEPQRAPKLPANETCYVNEWTVCRGRHRPELTEDKHAWTDRHSGAMTRFLKLRIKTVSKVLILFLIKYVRFAFNRCTVHFITQILLISVVTFWSLEVRKSPDLNIFHNQQLKHEYFCSIDLFLRLNYNLFSS